MSMIAIAMLLAGPAGERWTTYVNPRFGFSVCYPAALLRPGPEPANGDGRVFAGNRVELRASGIANALEQNPATAADEDAARFAGGGLKVTYRAVRTGWYALAATDGRRVV